MRTVGVILLAVIALGIAAAPVLAPNDPARQFAGQAYAPPMPPRVMADGELRRPFIYPVTAAGGVDRRERRFEERRDRPANLAFFTGGRVIASPAAPWLPLGGDPLGRDLFSRLLWGGRLSVGVALVAVTLTLAIGTLAGGAAGFAGGVADRIIMSVADFAIVLPLIYVVVTLRAALPLALATATLFWTIAAVMGLASWPVPARAVRAVIAAERQKEYAEAAYAAGAGPLRILLRHLLPAASGQLATHGILLFPAFVFAEATLSFVGLGFADPSASWGLMLRDAGSVSAIVDAPWLLAPAAAIVLAVFGARLLLAGERGSGAVPLT
jgi:peptide/nickel transport system permease protein